jgi:hypothetical protein
MLPELNSMLPVEDLMRLNDVLRKATTAGYQTAAGTSGADAGNLSPLIPQSIESVLSTATYGMSELALWNKIPKTNVSQTLHEYAVVKDWGFDVDPFIGEGGGSESEFVTNNANYERKSVKIKYMAERRQISDVASLVGLLGDNRQAIAQETLSGTMSLMRKVERQLWHGSEALNANGFDGICKQIKDNAPSNVHDLAGKAPTPLLLQEILGHVYSAPNYGRPDTIYVEPRIHAELIKQSVESGRHDQFMVQQASNGLTFGASQLSIMAPYGAVPIVAAPFLHYCSNMPSTGFGQSAPSAPTFAVNPAAANNASSKFVAGDAGDYLYGVIAVNDKGYSSPLVRQNAGVDVALTIAAGQSASFTITGVAGVKYYRIFRSTKGGGRSTMQLIKEVAASGANNIVVTDHNDGADGSKHNTSKIVFAQHDPTIFEFARLLDFLRRPLAEVATVKPFLLMLFGSPIVKVPSKMFMIENAGINAASGL